MVSLFQHSFSSPGAAFFLPTSPGVPPEAARPARCGGCPVPDGDPSCRVFSSCLPGVLACRRRRRAPPSGVAARCRTVTRPAGFFLPTCPESWRAAGGGAPRLVGWLPGAGRWPGPPGLFFLRVMACRRRRRALPGGVAARCRTVTRAAGVILPASHGVPPEAARPARWGGCPVPDGDPSCRVYSSYESWRAAGGGAPCPVGWLPGAGRWPALPPAGARAALGGLLRRRLYIPSARRARARPRPF